MSPASAVLEEVLQVRVADIPNAIQRQAPMLQTSAVQRMGGGRIRDRRAAFLHDPEGLEREIRVSQMQIIEKIVRSQCRVSQDSPSTGTSMLSWSRSGGYHRRGGDSSREEPDDVGGTDRSRESAATDRQHTCKSPESKLPRNAYARPQSGCASSNVTGRIREDEHRLTEEAKERRLLLLEEEKRRSL